jgi:hypothetical protein
MGVRSDSRFSCAILDFLIQDLTPEKNATAKKSICHKLFRESL